MPEPQTRSRKGTSAQADYPGRKEGTGGGGGEGEWGLLTAFILWMLDQYLKLQPENAWILGILVTALQREVEVPGYVPRLLVLQLEHLGVGGGAWDAVLNPLLLLHAVGDIEVEEGDARPQVRGDDELPCHELVLGEAVRVVGRHQGGGAFTFKHRFDDAQACWGWNPNERIGGD